MQEPVYPKTIAFPGSAITITLTERLLGKGQQGEVRYAYLSSDPNKYYAVKVVDRRKVRNKQHQLLVNEIEIMSEIQHPNVVKLITGTKTRSNFYIVMEYCNGGDLRGFIDARGGFLLEHEARLVLRQLVQGLAGIRVQNVMHRDLKLPNVLIKLPTLTKEEAARPGFSLRQFVS